MNEYERIKRFVEGSLKDNEERAEEARAVLVLLDRWQFKMLSVGDVITDLSKLMMEMKEENIPVA